MAFHARLSASSAKRFISCPGSVELIDRMPEHMKRGSSFPARQGTAAHALGEYCLVGDLPSSRALLGGWIGLDEHEDARVHPPLDGEEGTARRADFKWLFDIDDNMCDAVDVYLELVADYMAELDGAEMLVERTFDMNWLRPNLGGTSDCTIWQFMGKLVVIDYKHGQGVAVEVEDNYQALQYALGMAHEVEWCFDEVELVIVQPRCPHGDGRTRRWTTTKERLLEHQATLAAAVDAVEAARAEPEAALRSGDWCTFCDVLPTCKEAMRRVKEVAKSDFDGVAEDIDPIEATETSGDMARLGQVLEWKPFISAFLRAADGLAARLLMQGMEVPGQKLVEKRANRKYVKTEEHVVGVLAEMGYGPDRTHDKPKLKSPAQLEKLGKEVKGLVNGVKVGNIWLVEPLAAKGPGGITMAPESDPRPAVAFSVGADFADIEEEENAGD